MSNSVMSTMTWESVRAACAMSVGRPVCEADYCEVTDFKECARVLFAWNDGAICYMVHDTMAQAQEHARSNGWRAKTIAQFAD